MLDRVRHRAGPAFARSWGQLPLNILINNAGVMPAPGPHDSLELYIGTNYFGHFRLPAPSRHISARRNTLAHGQ